jgi:hypothetical protein
MIGRWLRKVDTGLDGGMAFCRTDDKSSEDRTAESFLDTLLLRTVSITLHCDLSLSRIMSSYLKLFKAWKKEEIPILSGTPRFPESIVFGEVSRLRPFVRLVRKTCRWGSVWSLGCMILTGENRSTPRKTCPSATLFATNLSWTDLESNAGLRGERPVKTTIWSYGTASKA